MLLILESENESKRCAAVMHAALNFISLQDGENHPPSTVALFIRSKTVLTNENQGFIEVHNKFSNDHLKQVGIKYLDDQNNGDELFSLLSMLHLSHSIKCLVLEEVETLMHHSKPRIQQTLALALSIPTVELLIVSTKAERNLLRPHVPCLVLQV